MRPSPSSSCIDGAGATADGVGAGPGAAAGAGASAAVDGVGALARCPRAFSDSRTYSAVFTYPAASRRPAPGEIGRGRCWSGGAPAGGRGGGLTRRLRRRPCKARGLSVLGLERRRRHHGPEDVAHGPGLPVRLRHCGGVEVVVRIPPPAREAVKNDRSGAARLGACLVPRGWSRSDSESPTRGPCVPTRQCLCLQSSAGRGLVRG